ncbi:peptidoglycan-binding domain-containing protein [Saccharothrix sp. NRRL B-16314]|uniref:peptidoglycan-binding domain-containing protein n=1 Tax=Saccharothrix sp. NRRL B-16314 TaxID=1463825 RepID=UPI0005258687|nr:peptidoglycan-binding domain-containing protein [Saccharothrix sp. NRRL B-16314]
MSARTRIAVGAGALVVLGAGGVAAVGIGGADPAPASAANLPPATAEVVATTLTRTERVTGTLGYGAATPLPVGAQGTITWLPEPGAVIGRGLPVYEVDGRPVPLLFGTTPAYRPLSSGVTGRDVRQLEENLQVLGYGGFTVDDTYTAGTATAVRAWQQASGVSGTGAVQPTDVVVAGGDVRVAELKAQPGSRSTGPVLTYTGTTRAVVVPLEVGKQHLVAEGVAATVTLPDGKSVEGKVESVGTVATAGPAQAGATSTTTVDVVVSVVDQAALGRLDSAPVDVLLVSERKEDVLAVPVGALVSLGGGAYGVQVVEGGAVRSVPVETGLFASGRVEVVGEGIAEGVEVGVPR